MQNKIKVKIGAVPSDCSVVLVTKEGEFDLPVTELTIHATAENKPVATLKVLVGEVEGVIDTCNGFADNAFNELIELLGEVKEVREKMVEIKPKATITPKPKVAN